MTDRPEKNERWALWEDGAYAAAMNMAIDETALENIAALGHPLLRFYDWEKPSVTIGYVQRRDAAPAANYDVARRPTGGGVVFHDVDLTYTVVLPPGHWIEKLDRVESYRVFHRAVVAALAALGQSAALAPEQMETPDRATMRCFVSPTRYDVLAVNGAKLAGAAQRRTKFGILHQGSVLLAPVGGDKARMIRVLKQGFVETLGAEFVAFSPPPEWSARARTLVTEKYGTDAWNYCR